MFDRGVAYRNLEDNQRAILDFTEAIKLGVGEAYAPRANARLAIRDYDGAIADYNDATRLNPKDVSSLFNRGFAYRAKRDSSAASRTSPQFWLWYRGISPRFGPWRAHFARGDYDHAIADFSDAIKINSSDSASLTSRGAAYHARLEYEAAIADYAAAIKLDPKNVRAWYNRGLAYSSQRDYDQAMENYREALKLGLTDARVWQSLAAAQYAKMDYDGAIASYGEALLRDQNSASLLCDRGSAYYAKGDYAHAADAYAMAIRLNPEICPRLQ